MVKGKEEPQEAYELRKAGRVETRIGAAAANTGKVFTESDVEVSEAIDFAEFYPSTARQFDRIHHIRARGRGAATARSGSSASGPKAGAGICP